MSSKFVMPWEDDNDVPVIDSAESFTAVVKKLSSYIIRCIDTPYTYEQLRTTFAGQSLKPLIQSLSEDCHHPALVAALMSVDQSSHELLLTCLIVRQGTNLCRRSTTALD